VAVGVCVFVGARVGLGVLVGLGVVVGAGVRVRLGVAVGAGVSVGAGVFVGLGVLVGAGVCVGPVGVGLGVFVGLGVLVGLGVRVAVGSIVGVRVGCGASPLLVRTAPATAGIEQAHGGASSFSQAFSTVHLGAEGAAFCDSGLWGRGSSGVVYPRGGCCASSGRCLNCCLPVAKCPNDGVSNG